MRDVDLSQALAVAKNPGDPADLLGGHGPSMGSVDNPAISCHSSGDAHGTRPAPLTLHSMAHPQRIEQHYRARFDESGVDGLMRSSSYLRYAQEMAWVHSELLGLDRAWYEQHQLTWVVRSLQLEVIAPIVHGQTFTVSTEVVGWRRALSRRRTELCGPDGSVAARVLIDWVGLGPMGRPVRIPSEIVTMLSDSGAATFEPIRAALPPAPPEAKVHEVIVRARDIDPMAHVNNATYLDFAEEGIEAAGGPADLRRVPRRYRLEYVTAAELGDRLTGTTWGDATTWAYRLSGDGARDILRATLETVPSAQLIASVAS